MPEFKITINNPKTGKSYNKILDTDAFKNKKIRDKISGDALGLKGYELEITGGSDTSGFPMRSDIEGMGRRRALLTGGVGVTIPRKGMKKRKTVRGNQVGLDVAQVNLKVVKEGSKKIEDLFGAKEEKKEEKVEEKPKEAKVEKKEENVEEKPKEEKKQEKKEEKPKEEKKEPVEEKKESPKEEPKKEGKK